MSAQVGTENSMPIKRTDFRAWLGLGLLAVTLSACGALRAGGGGGEALPPPPTREPAGPPTPTPEPVTVSEETTAGQLERFELVWQQLRQGYAFPDYNGVDWDAIEDIYRTQVADGMTEEMFQAAMAAMVSELGDGSTFYLTPEIIAEQQEALERAEDGPETGYVGTLVGMPDGVREVMTILYVFPGSPAEEAGVQPHDVIVGIDGEPVPPEPEADILERVRGEVGSEVVLTVKAPGEEPRDLTVGRAPLDGGGEIEVKTLEGDIGYIFIPPGMEDASLGTRVTNAVRSLREEENVEGLILDLRITRASQEWPVNELLGLFVHGEAYELYNATQSETISVTGKNVAGSQDLPLVVLASHDTAGPSEVFVGSLQALGRATVVGAQTDGMVETVFTLGIGEDAVLVFSGATARSLDGQPWGRVGVSPDVEVDLLWEEFTAEDDAQLEAAIEALQG